MHWSDEEEDVKFGSESGHRGKETSSEEEEEDGVEYEYVMEDLPQETAVFGPSRPLTLDEPQQKQRISDSEQSDEYQ